MLLIDADHAEPLDRREDGGTCADDDARFSARDPLALVAPLRVGERRVEDGDSVAEARAEAADRLRRQRDLRDENDRAESTLERRRARAEVDLGLAAARCPVQQQVTAAALEQLDDPCERAPLSLGQRGGLSLFAP